MAETLQFRGGNTIDVNSGATTVSTREIVIDTDTAQIVSGPSKLRTVMEDSNGNISIAGSAEFASDVKIGGTLPASPNITLNADGSAEFASGRFTIGGGGGTIIDATTSTGGNTVFRINSQDGTNRAVIRANGSADFAGDVKSNGNILTRNVVVELEADDDTKYTTTTDAEGNETRVYNGATLDVKDRLTKTDAALQSLKAALATTTDHESLKAALIAALADI